VIQKLTDGSKASLFFLNWKVLCVLRSFSYRIQVILFELVILLRSDNFIGDKIKRLMQSILFDVFLSKEVENFTKLCH
jgi:hypothetical protein